LTPGDVILGHVEFKKSYGVHIQIDSFEGGEKHRYISDLSIQVLLLLIACSDLYGVHLKGFIGLKNLASSVEDQDCLMKDLQHGDVLRGKNTIKS